MARKRVVEAPSLHSWEDVNDALRQIAEAQIALGEIQSDMQKQILLQVRRGDGAVPVLLRRDHAAACGSGRRVSPYKSYLSNDRGKSPAQDDADTTAAMNKVTAMPY